MGAVGNEPSSMHWRQGGCHFACAHAWAAVWPLTAAAHSRAAAAAALNCSCHLHFSCCGAGDDALSQVVNAAINFKPLFSLMKARRKLLSLRCFDGL
jgi:hypothetical protein